MMTDQIPLIDDLVQRSRIVSDRFKADGRAYIAKPWWDYTVWVRMRHAWAVLRGTARAYQYREDR